MIKEAYVSYEISLLLDEKGFEEETTWYYNSKGVYEPFSAWVDAKPYDYSPMPTLQMACAWLREVHKVLIVIDAYHADHWDGYIDGFEISIYSHASTIIVPNEIVHHTDYTEAVEAAIKYSLENLI